MKPIPLALLIGAMPLILLMLVIWSRILETRLEVTHWKGRREGSIRKEVTPELARVGREDTTGEVMAIKPRPACDVCHGRGWVSVPDPFYGDLLDARCPAGCS